MIDPEPYIKQAAWKAGKHLPTFLDREDLEQEARIALWLKPPVEGDDKKHTDNLTRLCAYRAMVDVLRNHSGRRRAPPTFVSLDEEDEHGHRLAFYEPTSTDDPERLAMIKQAVERLERKRSSPRLMEYVSLMVQGMEHHEAALVMGLTESRICQMRKEARTLLNTCL